MGNVLCGGDIGRRRARAAAMYGGIPTSGAHNDCGEARLCGSGLQAVVLGAKSVLLGDAHVVIAGGMESMSNVPYYLREARAGYRMGDGKLVDGMIFDGLCGIRQRTTSTR